MPNTFKQPTLINFLLELDKRQSNKDISILKYFLLNTSLLLY